MKKSTVVCLAIMAVLIAAGWMMMKSWGIWLIAAAAVMAGAMPMKGWRRK